MRYYSLNNKAHYSNFENAVLEGLAPDRGLYFPDHVEQLPASFFKNIDKLTDQEIAYQVIKNFVGDEIPESSLKEIINNTLDFDFPLEPINDHVGSLELFHGPTLAFKDVGARFMAGCLGYFTRKSKIEKLTVLVATSGDTGGAVANGFLNVKGIDVVILYPKGMVSKIQEQQLTTLGSNIKALEVDGPFDLCQEMVKKAFLDKEITKQRRLTSANSINVARWLPQMFYYFLAWRQVKHKAENLVFSVPSGNFGNICAGLMAKKMGLPISHFVASNNENNVVTKYLDSGEYKTAPTIATISNAMDVGDPSNFVRILEIFDNKFDSLKDHLSSYSFSDKETKQAIREVFEQHNYIMDPHGAVGYLGLKKFLKINPDYYGVFLETAHPVKFADTVEEVIGESLEIPGSLEGILDKQKISVGIKDYKELKDYLLN